MCSVLRTVTEMPEIQSNSANLSIQFTGPCIGKGKSRTWEDIFERFCLMKLNNMREI